MMRRCRGPRNWQVRRQLQYGWVVFDIAANTYRRGELPISSGIRSVYWDARRETALLSFTTVRHGRLDL